MSMKFGISWHQVKGPGLPIAPAKLNVSPLFRRMMRWHIWAARLAACFGVRASRLSRASTVLLQRLLPAGVQRQVNHWHISRPQGSCLRPVLQFLLHAHAGAVALLQPKNGDSQRSVARIYLPGGQKQRGPAYGVVPFLGLQRNRALEFATEIAGPRREFTAVGEAIHFHTSTRMAALEALTLRFLKLRQRVEPRPGTLSRSWHAGVVEPAARVYRQDNIPREMTPARTDQKQWPAGLPTVPFKEPLPPIDLNQLTDHVMKQIDRRLVIWRERTGRV